MGRKTMPRHASNPDKLSVGELARLTGVNVETVRYYEHIGLLPTPPKTTSGRRVFGSEHLSALSFIKQARDLGFGIKDVRELLALRHRHDACDDAKAIAAKHLASLRAKLNDLIKLERIIASAIDKCSGSVECPVLEIIETAGTIGRLAV
jgi:MerR family mercuric resistance operon transcriptional regulator